MASWGGVETGAEVGEVETGGVLEGPRWAPWDAELSRYSLRRADGLEVGAAEGWASLGLFRFVRARLLGDEELPDPTLRPSQRDLAEIYSQTSRLHDSLWALNAEPVGRLVAANLPVRPRPSARAVWEWRRALVLADQPAQGHRPVLLYLLDWDLFVRARSDLLRWLPAGWAEGLPPSVRLEERWRGTHEPWPSAEALQGVRMLPRDAVDCLGLRLRDESLLEGMVRTTSQRLSLLRPVPASLFSAYKARGPVEEWKARTGGEPWDVPLDPLLFHVLPTTLALDRQYVLALLQQRYGGHCGPSEGSEAYRVPEEVVEGALAAGVPLVAATFVRHNVDLPLGLLQSGRWWRVRLVSWTPGRLGRGWERGLVTVEDLDTAAIIQSGVEGARFDVSSRDLFYLTQDLAVQPVPRYYAGLQGIRAGTDEARHLMTHWLLGRHSVEESSFRPASLDRWLRRRDGLLNADPSQKPVFLFLGQRTVHLPSGSFPKAELHLCFPGPDGHDVWLNDFLLDPPDGKTAFAKPAGDDYADFRLRRALDLIVEARRRLYGRLVDRLANAPPPSPTDVDAFTERMARLAVSQSAHETPDCPEEPAGEEGGAEEAEREDWPTSSFLRSPSPPMGLEEESGAEEAEGTAAGPSEGRRTPRAEDSEAEWEGRTTLDLSQDTTFASALESLDSLYHTAQSSLSDIPSPEP